MANTRNGNTYYIDTTGSLAVPGVAILSLTITGSGGAAVLELQDVTTTAPKGRWEVEDDTTQLFDYSDHPIVFPNGISVVTATTCAVVAVIREARK